MSDGFAMELCGNQASWQIVPEGVTSIDLEHVGAKIIESGFEAARSSKHWLQSGFGDAHLSTQWLRSDSNGSWA